MKKLLLFPFILFQYYCFAQNVDLGKKNAQPDDLPNFIHTGLPNHLDTKNLNKDGPAYACFPQIIVYDPCCNKFKILYAKEGKYGLTDRLHYERGNGRVIFVINNYNTLKYTATVGTSYVNNYTDIPALWQSLTAAAGGNAPYAPANPDAPMVRELQQIMKLYLQLRTLLQTDCISCSPALTDGCSDFEGEKAYSISQITQIFSSLNILTHYSDKKNDWINAKGVKISNDSFNTYFGTSYLINLLPDSLASYTQSLVNTLASTSFYSQFNVPQLQNADKILFAVGLQPNTGSQGMLNVPSQTISVPIRGGWKWDWSTGFFYSNKKNENYALKPTGVTDTAGNIVREKDFRGGTFGLSVMLHAYPRTGSPFNGGFVLGFGKSLDINYAAFAGGSLMIGRDNRFAISSGLSISNIKALSGSQSVDLQLPSSGAINYHNYFKAGFFISFTYSFSVSQSTQASPPSAPVSATSAPASAASPAATPGTPTKKAH